jgi:anti-sigma-K factor RskA
VTGHDQWDELAAGYALDALEPAEELRFTEHLATCADCRATLADHDLVAAQLGSLAYDDGEPDEPPSWSAIRASVVGDSRPASLDEHRRTRRRQPWLLAAAAAVVAAVAAIVVVSQTTGGSTPASTRAIASCRHTAGCSVVHLHASNGADPGVVLVSAGKATMVPLAMKPAAVGTQYVLWQLLRSGPPVPVDGFRSGTALQSAPLVAPYADTAAFAVSVEPATWPPAQPTHVVATGNTSA